MNAVTSHLEKLKTFVPTSKYDGVNKLYFLEVIEKPSKVKAGDTHRDVERRNQETMTNAALHRKPGTEPIYVVAKMWDGTVYRDKKFHAFLKKKGYTFEKNDQGNDSEWVEDVTVDQLFIELAEFTRKPVYKTAEWRLAQNYILEKEQQAINEGYQFVNADYCMRSGKTLTSLEIARQYNWMPVYLGKNLTSQHSAESDNTEYGIVPHMTTESLHGLDDKELEDSELSDKVKKIIENIESKNKLNQKIAFYIDEVDDSSHTRKSRDVIVPVVRYFMSKGLFGYMKTMTGTRSHRGMKILRELAGDCPIRELSLAYYEMQILQPETTCRRAFRHINFYSEKSEGLVNISDAMKNKEHGHKSLATFIEKLLGTNNFDIKVDNNFPHWFIKFATVGKDNANKLVYYLNRNYSIIENKKYHFAAINGDVTKAKEAQDYCKDIIKTHTNKICVFITQGMATTSFSVASIGNSVVFTDNELTADDNQALYRSATWEEGKDKCNMIVVTTNNSMEHSFDDIFEDEIKIAKTREEKNEIYKELLTNNSMIHFHELTGFAPVKITEQNAEMMLDKKAEAMTKIASLMNVLNDLDEELIDDILSTVTGKKNTSKKSGTDKPDSFSPFGNPDNKKLPKKQTSDNITISQKEKIIRAFAENAVNVPAIAREQETTIEEFKFWNELNVSKELFFNVYNSSRLFKDRIDTIYNLCSDETYLIETYINKISV